MKVVFVCHGNTCRSPMAEIIFKSLVDNIEVLSAGIAASNGEKAAPNAIKICEFNNLDLKNHKSKNFYILNIENDDLILTLTQDIRDTLKESYPNLEIYTIKEYSCEKQYLDIKDPVGGDLSIYEMCFHEIKESLEKIVEIHPEKFDIGLKATIETVKDENKPLPIRLGALGKIQDEYILYNLTYSISTIIINRKVCEKIKNHQLLVKLALDHPKFYIRQIACRNLRDNSILNQVYKNDSNEQVRLEAVKNIEDDEILKDILLNAKDTEILVHALNGISDNDVLCDILEDLKEPYIIKYIKNPKMLEFIAQNSPYFDVRQKAVEKIFNEEILNDIALNDSSNYVRLCAIKKVNNQEIIIKSVLNDLDIRVRCLAISKVSDQSLLNEIALHDEDLSARITAANHLNKQSSLEYLALNDSEYDIRFCATSKIVNDNVLKEIFFNEESGDIRNLVIMNLTNDSYLMEIAYAFPEYANSIIDYISDESYLVSFCCFDDWKVRRKAIKKIFDESLLCKICCNSRFDDVLFPALSKISSEKMFIKIIQSESKYYVRRISVKKIKNKDVLKDLALCDDDEEIRRIASKHI